MNPPRTKVRGFLNMLLILYILNHRTQIPMANSTNKVPFRPKAICPDSFFQAWKQFSQLFTGTTFDQLHNPTRTVCGFGSKQQVYMVRLDVKLHNLKVVNLRTKTNHAIQTFFNVSYQFSLTILGYKSKVIRNIIGSVSNMFNFHILKFIKLPKHSFLCLQGLHSSHALTGRGFLQCL